MFLQTNLHNRRQFLERSMWGFGGLLVSSSLMQSCIKDHIMPDPPMVLPPMVGADQDPNPNGVDWNEIAKITVVTGLKMIPEVGEILGPLAEILWPNNVWDQVKGQVEALINQKISDYVYQNVSEDLTGLYKSLTLYREAINAGDVDLIKDQWISTRNSFTTIMPHFQSAGYELLLLPLFAQFTNLYLSFLRDPLTIDPDKAQLRGISWGMPESYLDLLRVDLTNAIHDAAGYTILYFQAGQANVEKAEYAGFYTVNNYNRQMTLMVLDYLDTWPSFDITTYPNGNTVVLDREIYTDPFGSPTKDIIIPTPVPTQRPTLLTVWSGNRVDAVQLTYPAGSGPAGVTQTARMGDANGGTGHQITINTDNAITQARAVAGRGVGSVQFAFNDGTKTDVFGKAKGVETYYTDSGWQAYPYRALYSIYVDGVFTDPTTEDNDLSASSIVFGFKIWITPPATLQAISAIYVYSPQELSMAKVAKAYPSLALSDASISSELKAARKAYWDAMKARYKK